MNKMSLGPRMDALFRNLVQFDPSLCQNPTDLSEISKAFAKTKTSRFPTDPAISDVSGSLREKVVALSKAEVNPFTLARIAEGARAKSLLFNSAFEMKMKEIRPRILSQAIEAARIKQIKFHPIPSEIRKNLYAFVFQSTYGPAIIKLNLRNNECRLDKCELAVETEIPGIGGHNSHSINKDSYREVSGLWQKFVDEKSIFLDLVKA